jgi:hypothetical protein
MSADGSGPPRGNASGPGQPGERVNLTTTERRQSLAHSRNSRQPLPQEGL